MKNKTTSFLIAMLASLFIFAAVAYAGPGGGPPGPGGAPGFFGRGGGARDKLHAKLEQMMIWELSNAMDLSPAKEKKFFDFLRTHFKARQEAAKKQFGAMNALNAAYNDPKQDTAKIKKALDSLQTASEASMKLEMDFHRKIRTILDVKEQARFYIEWPQVLDKVRDTIQEKRGKMKGQKKTKDDNQ